MADKMIQDTEKKLKNSIKMATEFKNKIESQKSEVLISLILNYQIFLLDVRNHKKLQQFAGRKL